MNDEWVQIQTAAHLCEVNERLVLAALRAEAAAESTTEVNEGWLAALLGLIFSLSSEDIPPAPLEEAVVRAIRDLTTKLPRLAPQPVR